jgi:tetratricopeptide (TPR) repeat protein
MHDERLAPDVGTLLSAGGFLSASPARAYTYAGAFLRDLQQRFGTPALLDLYAHGDLSRLGAADELIAAFEKRLSGVPVDAGHRAAAARRYAGRGLVERPCGRESARLVEEAHGHAVRRDKEGVVSTMERACALDPDDPALLRSLLDAALEAGDDAAAALAEQRLFAHPRLDPGLEARALMDLGRSAWRRGDLPSARGYYARALRLPVDATTRRQAFVHAHLVTDDGLAAVTKPLLVEGRADAGVLFTLQDAILARPDDALLPYLLGRQFVQQEAPARGAQLLAARAIGRLGDAALEREAVRLAVRGFAMAGDCDAAEEVDRSQTRDEADAALAATWVSRCRFEQGLRTP